MMMTTITYPQMVYEKLRSDYHIDKKAKITTPEDILQIKQIVDLSKKSVEHFNIITLNAASEVIKVHNITKGLLNYSMVHPREVFRAAIRDNALSIIAIHNHPSGKLEPSSADIKVTKQLSDSGKIIDIHLLDHIIISRDGILSMNQGGYI